MNSSEIRRVTDSLSRAIASGETEPGGAEPVRFAADMLRAEHPELVVPEEMCPGSLLVGLIVGGATMRALVEMED